MRNILRIAIAGMLIVSTVAGATAQVRGGANSSEPRPEIQKVLPIAASARLPRSRRRGTW